MVTINKSKEVGVSTIRSHQPYKFLRLEKECEVMVIHQHKVSFLIDECVDEIFCNSFPWMFCKFLLGNSMRFARTQSMMEEKNMYTIITRMGRESMYFPCN